MRSESPEWREAIDKDSAVPDNYARTNVAEVSRPHRPTSPSFIIDLY